MEKLTAEENLIYSIIESWGNAACGIQVMEKWIKQYAQQQSKELAIAYAQWCDDESWSASDYSFQLFLDQKEQEDKG